MLIPRPFQKFIGILRGGVSPVLILLSAALGFWFGLMPGFYGIHVVLLVAVLLLNVNIGIFLLLAGLGEATAFAAAPVLYFAGKWLLTWVPGLFALLAAIPIVGLTDYSRYAVAGAVLLGPGIGLLLGWLLARAVVGFRRKWLRFEEGSEALRNWRSKRFIRFLDWLLVGRSVKDVRAVLASRPKLIRKAGVVLAGGVLAASAVGALLVDDRALADFAANRLTQLNGAEADVERIDLSAFSGRIEVAGLQLTDPERPSRNRLAVGRMTADASIWALLAGKLVIEHAELSGVRFDQPRSAPGKVLSRPAEPRTASRPTPRFELPDPNAKKIEAYFENARRVREWLERVAKWLPSERKPQPAALPPQRYSDYLLARAELGPSARILVRRLFLDPVEIPLEQLGASRILVTNLSDAPEAAKLPVIIQVRSNEKPVSAKIVVHFEEPRKGAQIEAEFAEVDLRRLQEHLSPNNPVVFEWGTVSGRIEGTMTSETIDLRIRIKTHDMRAKAAGAGVVGLDPRATSEALAALGTIETTLRIVGPITEPRLVFDAAGLREAFADALVRAGKKQLAQRLQQAIGGEPGSKKPAAAPGAEKAIEAVGDGLKGLLGGGSSSGDGKKDKR